MDPADLRGPVYNRENFSRLQGSRFSTNASRSMKYVPINDCSSSIQIKSELRSILIDYLHCHWLKANEDEDISNSNKTIKSTGTTTTATIASSSNNSNGTLRTNSSSLATSSSISSSSSSSNKRTESPSKVDRQNTPNKRHCLMNP